MTPSSFNNKPFKQLTPREKSQFIAKLVVFICTFGFGFGTLLHSDEYVAKYH